jgi:choline dehydrogenase-like flavoprotein
VNGDPIVVIGSGPAGAAAARALCNAGARVLVLEAGARRRARGLTVRAKGLTVFRFRRPLESRSAVHGTGDPRVIVHEDIAPGGLSNHWSCAVPRFSEADFADARRAGEAFAWPIDYGDLAPWYDEVEPLLRISGAASSSSPQVPAGHVSHVRTLAGDWARVANSAAEFGRGLLPTPYAFGDETTLTPSGTVFNAFVRLIEPERRAGRLDVRYDARVVRLEWSASARRVSAVVCADPGGAETRVACRAVVVAASALRSIEILLRSKSADFPAGLGNTDGVLGRYLHDHPLGKILVDLDVPLPLSPPAYLTRPDLERAQPLLAAACLQWGGAALMLRTLLDGHPGRTRRVGFNLFGSMRPRVDDGIGLDSSSGAEGALDLGIVHPPEAIAALDQARDDLLATFERSGMGPRVHRWRVEPVGESNHFGGTCRMHRSPRFGMLDGWSRMHAVPNVAVADSAAFTTGPEKNPVLTAMALAARAADRLARDVRSGDI